MNGQEIKKYSFNKNSELVSRVLDLKNLKSGLYFVRIEAGDAYLTRQIVKTN